MNARMGSMRRRAAAWFTVLALILQWAWAAGAAEVKLPLLKTKSVTYSNVVVTSRSPTDLYIKHEQGIGNVKIADIDDDEALIALGLKAPPPKPGESRTMGVLTNKFVASVLGTNKPIEKLMKSPAMTQAQEYFRTKVDLQIILIAASVVLLIHVFWSYCLLQICKKSGYEASEVIWIPWLQWIPVFRAVGMTGWWVLGMLIPLLNLVGGILWTYKVVQIRRKHMIWMVALWLPVTNLIAFLYLAFSKADT